MSGSDDSGGLLARKGAARPSIAREPAAEPAATGKAAFTLRLDADRHARLRLASAVTGRSSQQLLIQALDALFETMPDVAELARRLPSRGQS